MDPLHKVLETYNPESRISPKSRLQWKSFFGGEWWDVSIMSEGTIARSVTTKTEVSWVVMVFKWINKGVNSIWRGDLHSRFSCTNKTRTGRSYDHGPSVFRELFTNTLSLPFPRVPFPFPQITHRWNMDRGMIRKSLCNRGN